MLAQLQLIAVEAFLAVMFLCTLIAIAILEIVDLLLVGLIKLVTMVPGFLPKSRT